MDEYVETINFLCPIGFAVPEPKRFAWHWEFKLNFLAQIKHIALLQFLQSRRCVQTIPGRCLYDAP